MAAMRADNLILLNVLMVLPIFVDFEVFTVAFDAITLFATTGM